MTRLGLPISACILSCRSIRGWMALWPYSRAATITSSGTSSAPASTIRMASRVPAMRRSRSDLSISAKVGLAMNWPSTRPTRTAATGPFQGMSEIIMAADAALMARMSNGFSASAESEYMMICTSLRMPSGKSGRKGRSVRRATNMASVEGRPSRRKNEPGILPPAYMRSS